MMKLLKQLVGTEIGRLILASAFALAFLLPEPFNNLGYLSLGIVIRYFVIAMYHAFKNTFKNE